MAIVKVELHKAATGVDHQDAYYLARDTARSRMFVEHDWVRRDSGHYETGVDEIDVHEFLLTKGPAQIKLRSLLAKPRPASTPHR